MPRLVIIGDGIVTLGEREPEKLAELARGFERVDVVQVGASLDRDTLAPIVHGGRVPGAIVDGSIASRVMRPLTTAVAAEQVIEVEGAAASWPLTTRGIAPGEPVFVLGLRDRTLAGAPLAVRIGGRRTLLLPHAADEHAIRRVVARAQIADLTERMQHADDRPALAKQIEALALEYNIASSQTSLIVLETDADVHRMLEPSESSAGGAAAPPDPAIDASSIDRTVPVPGRTFEGTVGEVIVVEGAAPRNSGLEVRSGVTVADREYARGVALAAPIRVDGRVEMSRGLGQLRQDIQIAEHDPAPEPQPVAPPPAPEPSPSFAGVMELLAKHDRVHALDAALRWHLASPGDLAAVIALGEAFEARGQRELAARAYGSILDLYPDRAELARAAGERFDRMGATSLAIDAYRRALRERPDQVATYRLLAYALVRAGRHAEALDLLLEGRTHTQRESIREILAEDAGLVAAAIVANDPAQQDAVAHKLGAIAIPAAPSLRIVLAWETDANDVDLHVYDRAGAHAWYRNKHLASGGDLLDDITTGFGPEMLVIDQPAAFPYRVEAHYYRMGPMGIGLGTAQVIRHDGAGHLAIDDHPFVIEVDGASVDLGTISAR